MAEQFKQGDTVEWSVGKGTTVGTVEKKVTQDTSLNGQSVKASESDPRYFVKNEHTGQLTSHRSEALSLVSEQSGQDNRFEPGDQVEWNTAQGKTSGTVKKKLTEPTQIKDYDVKASEDNPKYLVESEQTGAKAAHKPDSLSAAE